MLISVISLADIEAIEKGNAHTRALIDAVAIHYHYRPLPQRIRDGVLKHYRQNLNGFDVFKVPHIGDFKVADTYERVVVGDYGAYVEFAAGQLLSSLEMPPSQAWRLNADYVAAKGLSIKYHHYTTLNQVMVYHQVATVKYADYKPGYYYISVLDFD